ncbi:RNA polymerase sigma factor [Pedobacter aquatilis]|uniref:RNA polymerase sigma factor n=1 Tax=Pedobacter aquatilis TaxID=351343 RepID=UPI00292E3513|nr:sigma-70 family RNA polymerase sigma factor [Pedobacter aquatilis]
MLINQKTDRDLLQAICLGEEKAFKLLFDRYWSSLYRLVLSQINDAEQSKDIVQNAFVTMWNNKENLVVGDSIFPYLAKITRNEIISLFRKNKVNLEGMEELIARLKAVNNPEHLLISKELESDIEQEVYKMPLNMKKCFQLSRYEHKSIRDISAELSLSEQTVKNNISEAMRRLRSSLKLT